MGVDEYQGDTLSGRTQRTSGRPLTMGQMIVVNEKPLEKAFPRMTLRNVIQFPFELAGVAGKYSVRATVYGGGPAGQAGALRHAISKALVVMSAAFRSPLKKEGLLTRDSRVKERKKYGQKGARKRFQYSKR